VVIDIYNNDIYVTGADFIEGDGGVHNIRIMRNRGLNAGHAGLSAQPIFGGPAYDGFAGRAPDLGAYEVGQPLPVYGPRGRTGTRPFSW
jgi:hypothetical protein